MDLPRLRTGLADARSIGDESWDDCRVWTNDRLERGFGQPNTALAQRFVLECPIVPVRSGPIGLHRWHLAPPVPLVAVDEDALVLPESEQFGGLDPVVLILAHADGAAAACPSHDSLPSHPASDELRAGLGIGFVGGLEDQPVTQVQGVDPGGVAAQNRCQGGGLWVAAITATFASRMRSTTLWSLMPCSLRVTNCWHSSATSTSRFRLGQVEPGQGVVEEEHLQKRGHEPALGLVQLWHGNAEDPPLVHVPEVEGRVPAEDLRDLRLGGMQEIGGSRWAATQ